MRWMPVAAALLAGTSDIGIAVAATPTIQVGQVVNYSLASHESATWKVNLTAGNDYALGEVDGYASYGGSQWIVWDASGRTIVSGQLQPIGYEGGPVGKTFRASYTGSYFVQV